MQMKTIMRYYFIPTRIAIIKKKIKNKATDGGYEGRDTYVLLRM